MSTRNPDPLAVIVAEALHQRYRPLATILFGSRARGDHREDSSDLDLLLVTREEVDFQEQGQVYRDALRRAMRTYGREVRVNLLWVTGEQLEHEGQYVNSSPTRAMLEGVCSPTTPSGTGAGTTPLTRPHRDTAGAPTTHIWQLAGRAWTL